MLRMLASIAIHLLANAVGLLIAAVAFSGFSIDPLAFIVVLLIFTGVEVLAGPLLLKISLKNLPALTGGIALVTTFVGLLITDVFSTGLTITGVSTWIFSTLVVWLCALLAGLILPLLVFKKVLNKNAGEQ